MVFKKPYAFLIKHFRLIHLILILPIAYLIYRSSRIVRFFNQYASSGSIGYSNNLAGSYINILMYLAIILILLIVTVITYLFIIKKKSIKFYIGVLAYYILLIIALTICYSAIAGLEDELMEIAKIRVYRDVALIFYAPQYFFLIYGIIRGLGFDIKKFDFNKDLKELEIEEQDSEEVEISFDRDNYKLKRKIHRYYREFKYYFFENQFIITIIGIIAAVILCVIGFYNYILYHRTYKQMQIVNINGFTYRINNSIITNLDYRGNDLKDKKYYLAISIDVTNLTTSKIKIAKKDLAISIDGKYYYPIYDRSDYYNDLGIPYRGEQIKPKKTTTYAIVYEIPKKVINKEINLVLINEYNVHGNDLVAKKKLVRIKPTYYLSSSKANEVKLNKAVKFSGTMLGESSLKVSEAYLDGYYEYELNGVKKIATPEYSTYGFAQAVFAIEDELILKGDSYYAKNITKKQLYNNHASLYFKVSDGYVIAPVTDITPKGLENVSILQADKRFINSSDVRLVITLRGRSFYIKLK